MIRVVLTVLVAVALLGASLPALDAARTTTTADHLDRESERLARAASGLAAESVAVDDPELAARVTVRVRVPTGFTTARIDRVVLGDPTRVLDPEATPSAAAGDALAADASATADHDAGSHGDSRASVALIYRIADGRVRVATVTPSVAEPRIRIADGPIALRQGGPNRVELRLVSDPETGDPVVRIARAG